MEDILDALCAEVPVELARRNPPALLRQVGRGSCVQATRVGIEALRYFGFTARPLVTLMITGNAAWCEWMAKDSPQPMPDEVWSVGVDSRVIPGQRAFPGHLVLTLGGLLIDLDAGFYSRPEHGIHIPPALVIPLTTEQRALDNGALAGLDLEGGGAILYGRHETPPDFRRSGAWRETQKWAGPVIRRMRDRLAVTA